MLTGMLAADLDHSIVRGLNGWFAASSGRIDLAKALAVWPLFVVIGLAVFAWFSGWGREDPERRGMLLLGLCGAVLALVGNRILGHFYYRPRPFVAMPGLDQFISHAKESSMYSDHLAAAGGLTAGILATKRWWLGGLAVLATVALAIGRIGASLHYPSDVAVGAAAGVVGFLLLLPLRRVVAGPVRWVESVERRFVPRRA
jgi:undecaprenyl-diphosphatase